MVLFFILPLRSDMSIYVEICMFAFCKSVIVGYLIVCSFICILVLNVSGEAA